MPTNSKKKVERRSNAERSAETQERILEATLECLSERGYAATSTNEVVRRAGVSRGALVHHFSSKSDLVAAAAVHLIRKRYATTQEQARELEGGEPSIHDKLAVRRRDYERWFPATIEFMVACRTDKALSESFTRAMLPYEESMGQSIMDEWPRAEKPRVTTNDPVRHGLFHQGTLPRSHRQPDLSNRRDLRGVREDGGDLRETWVSPHRLQDDYW